MIKTKEILKSHEIPTADHEVFYRNQKETIQRSLELPVVVKPNNQGSSFGVSIQEGFVRLRKGKSERNAAIGQSID